MANVKINIPDAKIDAVIESFCRHFGWTSSSTMTKKQFFQHRLLEFVRDIYTKQATTDFDTDKKKYIKNAKDFVSDITAE